MTWNLFIDDERNPEVVVWAPPHILEKYRNEEWAIARNFYEVGNLLWERGQPSFVSFDHDLGMGEATGYDIAKYMMMLDMDSDIFDKFGKVYPLPTDFDYYVHSMNPVGKQNIESYLNNYLKSKGN